MPRPYTSAAQYTAEAKSIGFMSCLKGKSSLMIFQKYGNMKFAYGNREFRCKGYYVDTVGKNTKAITEYIADQLKRDKEADQLSHGTRLRVAGNERKLAGILCALVRR